MDSTSIKIFRKQDSTSTDNNRKLNFEINRRKLFHKKMVVNNQSTTKQQSTRYF
jgi:hypothetical protein